jgi:hypothetical protein
MSLSVLIFRDLNARSGVLLCIYWHAYFISAIKLFWMCVDFFSAYIFINEVSISRTSIYSFLTDFAFAQEKEERLNLSFTWERRELRSEAPACGAIMQKTHTWSIHFYRRVKKYNGLSFSAIKYPFASIKGNCARRRDSGNARLAKTDLRL